MPYVEVWIDDALPDNQFRALESLIKVARDVAADYPSAAFSPAMLSAAEGCAEVFGLAARKCEADRKYREWQARRAGAADQPGGAMSTEATLAQRMRQLSWMPMGEASAEDLREKADALDAAIDRGSQPGASIDDMRRMLGAWARARRLWCDVTGKDLV
jgi:hypothetical protein